MHWHFSRLPRLAAYLTDHVFEWGVAAFVGWLRWFWRLSPIPKLAAIFGQVLVLYVCVSWLSLGLMGFALVRLAAVALVVLGIASLLLGATGARR